MESQTEALSFTKPVGLQCVSLGVITVRNSSSTLGAGIHQEVSGKVACANMEVSRLNFRRVGCCYSQVDDWFSAADNFL